MLIFNRLIQILVPAILLSLPLSLIDICCGLDDSLYRGMVNNLWFLKSLSICYTITVVIQLIKIKLLRYLILGIVLIGSFYLPIYKLNYMFPSFVFGFYLGQFEKLVHDFLRTLSITTTFIFFSLLLLNLWCKLPFIASLTLGMTGALFFFLLFSFYIKDDSLKSNLFSKLNSVGRNTMAIYILQSFILERFIKIIYPNNQLSPFWEVLAFLLLSIILLFALNSFSNYLRKYPISSYLLFGRFTKSPKPV